QDVIHIGRAQGHDQGLVNLSKLAAQWGHSEDERQSDKHGNAKIDGAYVQEFRETVRERTNEARSWAGVRAVRLSIASQVGAPVLRHRHLGGVRATSAAVWTRRILVGCHGFSLKTVPRNVNLASHKDCN